MVLTTYVAQAGLLCLLLRMFRFSIVIACLYLALCAVVQGLILVIFFSYYLFFIHFKLFQAQRFANSSFTTSAFGQPQVLAFYVIQRTCMSKQISFLYFESTKFHLVSVLYYYGMKRAGYRLSDPHFYQSSKWLQNLW